MKKSPKKISKKGAKKMKKLQKYREKRDFSKTNEPNGDEKNVSKGKKLANKK